MRAPVANHLIVRLADEGVPIAAIARTTLRPFDDITLVLKEAIDQGDLITLPSPEWKFPSVKMERCAPERFLPVVDLVLSLQLALRLTPAEARMLSFLMARQMATKNALHLATQTYDHDTEPKIVDVFVCKLRKKLRPHGIEIKTIWGRGYAIDLANRERVQHKIAEVRGTKGSTTLCPHCNHPYVPVKGDEGPDQPQHNNTLLPPPAVGVFKL